ncbi:ABC transporter permease [Alkalihalobacillus hemicellulosilyticus]|uniref:Multidrug ABC transporter permease n=1 Tax=Halalkalibacter hemicellulosilyticusJCM 9152 TaxID=1236971 RepID=W4Q9U4_9BACI|nr:ABC transporter permease [Halalkalibacter hemicellulosilyticus]GAE28780.1 multidrug ABC transporter permease [Halalkalibacter hemicellulosilyticusJCM 9152]
MRVWSTIPYTVKRLSRDFMTILLLLLLPMVILTVFSFILPDVPGERGFPIMEETAMYMIVGFQLFGGCIAMAYIYLDFFTERRHRIQTLPMNHTVYAFTIMLIGTIFSVILGIILMVFSQFALGVNWSHPLWSIVIISLMSLLSSIVCLILVFSVNNYKLAERLSEVYGLGAFLMAGLFFPMPDLVIIEWFNQYVNPLTISYAAIFEYNGVFENDVIFHVLLLIGYIVVLFAIMLALGRRRMP